MWPTAEPYPLYCPGRSGSGAWIATSDEVRLCPPKPERDNPLKAPTFLLDVADSSVTDTLQVVIHNLRELPSKVQASFERHFDTRLIEDLSILHRALDKLRRNELPTLDEINLLTDTREVLEDLPEDLRNCAHREEFPEAVGTFVETQIAAPLEGLGACRLTDGAVRGVIQLWQEAVYPDDPAGFTPHGP